MPGIWLKNLDQMRKVQWSAAHLWEVRFPKPGAGYKANTGGIPLNMWFPATDFEENLWTLEVQSFAIGMTTIEIPKNTTFSSIKLTFVDDVFDTVSHWITHWVNNEILNADKGRDFGVSPLEECIKELEVVKFDQSGNQLSFNKYFVFPKGVFLFGGKSTSDVHSYDIDFVSLGSQSS